MGKPIVITFANQKGGVGKTTSAVNIAAAVGAMGYKVLLCDLDPQGNATSGCGISKKSLRYSAYDALIGSCDPKMAVYKTDFQNLCLPIVLIGQSSNMLLFLPLHLCRCTKHGMRSRLQLNTR